MLPYHHVRSYPKTQKEHHQQSPDMLSWNTTPNNGSSSPNFNFVPTPNVGDHNKLIDFARKGFSQFRKDFIDDGEDVEVQGKEAGVLGCDHPVFLVQKSSVELREAKTPAKFGVDDEVFEDRRPVVDFVKKLGGGQREFRLFEGDDRMTEVMKSVYNVNNIDVMVPWEMCSRRMYPRSIERWPIDVVGLGDFSELRKNMLLSVGRSDRRKRSGSDPDPDGEVSSSSVCSEEGQERECCDVAYGLRSLASLMSGEGVEGNPMGFLTFAGMNLNKLMKHLDRKEPITPTFAGPFAEHNFCLDYGRVGVSKGYEEYEFLKVGGGLGEDGGDSFFKWKNTIRIKRSLLSLFSFEILAFIFYTFYGDALQLLAASELYRRGWRYHKLFQIWISPWAGQPDYQLRGYVPPIKTVVDESLMRGWPSGVYVYFHYGRWEFCTKEFKVNDGVLEGRPVGYGDGLWE